MGSRHIPSAGAYRQSLFASFCSKRPCRFPRRGKTNPLHGSTYKLCRRRRLACRPDRPQIDENRAAAGRCVSRFPHPWRNQDNTPHPCRHCCPSYRVAPREPQRMRLLCRPLSSRAASVHPFPSSLVKSFRSKPRRDSRLAIAASPPHSRQNGENRMRIPRARRAKPYSS